MMGDLCRTRAVVLVMGDECRFEEEWMATRGRKTGGRKSGTDSPTAGVPLPIAEPRVAESGASSEAEATALSELNVVAARLARLDLSESSGMLDAAEDLARIAATCRMERCIQREIEDAAIRIARVAQKTSADPSDDFAGAVGFLDAATNALRETLVAESASCEDGPSPKILEPAPITDATPGREEAAGPKSTPSTKRATSPAAAVAHGDGELDTIRIPPEADPSFVSEFVTECLEYVAGAEAGLLSLESDPEQSEAINTVFRAFHTIKGTSGFLGFDLVTNLAHKAENLLSRARDHEILCTGGYADLALRSVDMLKMLIEGIHKALAGAVAHKPLEYEGLLRVLCDPEAAGISAGSSGPCIDLGPDEAAISNRDVTAASPSRGAETSETACDAPNDPSDIPQTVPAPASSGSSAGEVGVAGPNPAGTARIQKKAGWKAEESSDSVRVRTDRLDRLIDMVGELVIAQSMVAQDEGVVLGAKPDLIRKVTHSGKIVRELQDLSMSMRMVPLKPTFQKMARLVRDLAHKEHRQVEFCANGEETEIDRNMVDVINDPLVHMIRNAVDHGIEPPETRVANGKNPTGHVALSAYHAGGNIVVELKDDGRGLDRERIVAKALARGVIESDKGMSDSEVFNLIFEAGFSTAEKITEVSGRGVGMDVVRRAVQSLRGRIEIRSTLGQGTTFLVKLPLTLAVTDGMLVRVGAQRFIVPTVSIDMSFRPEASGMSTIKGTAEMVMLRGSLVPIIRLHRLFAIPGAVEDPTSALLVVVDDGDRRSALLVDDLLGQQQVVAKTLGDSMKTAGIAGGAILGDGRVGLILDPPGLVALARGGQSADTGTILDALAA
jgi:two-component system, chemotaxis family, sensor kinase CheA